MILRFEEVLNKTEAVFESKCQEHMAKQGVTAREVEDAGACEDAPCKDGCPFFKRWESD